jgi:2Fe-2S ferredoxin
MPKMTFIQRDGTRKEVDAPLGLSVLEIAHKHGVDIEGACEGSLACSTCHVIVDQKWFEMIQSPTEDEEDMLDLAFGLEKTSRLGCQMSLEPWTPAQGAQYLGAGLSAVGTAAGLPASTLPLVYR